MPKTNTMQVAAVQPVALMLLMTSCLATLSCLNQSDCRFLRVCCLLPIFLMFISANVELIFLTTGKQQRSADARSSGQIIHFGCLLLLTLVFVFLLVFTPSALTVIQGFLNFFHVESVIGANCLVVFPHALRLWRLLWDVPTVYVFYHL